LRMMFLLDLYCLTVVSLFCLYSIKSNTGCLLVKLSILHLGLARHSGLLNLQMAACRRSFDGVWHIATGGVSRALNPQLPRSLCLAVYRIFATYVPLPLVARFDLFPITLL
jgi:hypothetical protein